MKVDRLNIALLALSLVLAYLFPFQLFLLAYAILGPLHYLTEINWIEERNFFLPDRSMAWIGVVCAALVFLPKLLLLPWLSGIELIGSSEILLWWNEYNNIFILLALVMAITFTLFRSWKVAILTGVAGILIGLLINQNYQYQMLIGLLLPTLIHVYLFTLFFMLYGSLKAGSREGLFAVVLMVVAPMIIVVLPETKYAAFLAPNFKSAFVNSEFYVTNAMILGWLGLSDGSEFSFTGSLDVKFQTFIAFAYTYHYLNWFTKTSVIKWHKSLDRKRSAVILIIWALSLILFYVDYFVGTIILLSLSVLHVILEFPINIRSITGIAEHFKKAQSIEGI